MRFRAMAVGLCGVLWIVACRPAVGQSGASEPKYNPATVAEYLATVVGVQELPEGAAMAGVHLTVKAGSDNLHVYLGPAAFLKDFEVTFEKGDRVQLTGSKVKWGGGHIVVAREIRKQGTTVYLRDMQGKPYWPAN
jgi:hypothetical protein